MKIESHDDEIDLHELFKLFRKDWWIVIASMFICLVASVAYSFMVQERWSASSIVTPSRVLSVHSYQKMINSFTSSFEDNWGFGKAVAKNKMDEKGYVVDSKRLFDIFILEFGSTKNKIDFLSSYKLKSNSVDQSRLEGEAVGEHHSHVSFADFSATYIRSEERPKYILKAQASNEQSAFLLLQDYTEHIRALVEKKLYQELVERVALNREELILKKDLLRSVAKLKLQREIELASYSLEIATNVDATRSNWGSDQLFPINLGREGLEKKIAILKNIKNLALIEPRLQEIDVKLAYLENMQLSPSPLVAFQYTKRPAVPASCDNLKRSLIIFFGLLLGGVLGVGIVLVKFTFRKARECEGH